MTWASTSDEFLDSPGGIGEDRQERLGAPFAKSTLLHLLLVGALLGYAYVHNFFHTSEWGSNSFEEGAIQATLVTSAALPLPQDHPPTTNVLATDTPSPAPALPQQTAAPIPLPEAIPIPQRQAAKKEEPKPKAEIPPRHVEPPPKPQNKAVYGEAQPANMPRATASTTNANSPSVQTGGDFGSRFGWYVNGIKTKVAQNWLLPEVSPGTPAGATVYVQFTVSRDGSPGGVIITTPSGSPSLDSSCLHAVQRVDTFGSLPAQYNESSLNVLYHCTYPGS